MRSIMAASILSSAALAVSFERPYISLEPHVEDFSFS